MRKCIGLAFASSLLPTSGCEGKADDDGERTRDEWIVLCEAQTGALDCEAIEPGTYQGETLRCQQLIIERANPDNCSFEANDSRCLVVGDASPFEPGYLLSEPGDSQVWLIDNPQDTAVYGSAVSACVLAEDGMSWTPDPLCGCAGNVIDGE